MSTTEVTARGRAFLAGVDGAVPGRLTGLYLVGSAALGDWREHLSNMDVVAVADAWDDAAMDAAMRARGPLGEDGGQPRVAFVTYEQLAAPPQRPGPVCREGRAQTPAAELANPLTWQILADDSVCLRGAEYFPVHVDAGELQRWAAERLAGRWASWLPRAGRVPGQLWRRRGLAEDLLEVTRLHAAATRGQVVSKLRSGSLVLDDVSGHYDRVVTDAVGYRRGSHTSMYWGPVERKHHTLELIGELIQRAREQLATP